MPYSSHNGPLTDFVPYPIATILYALVKLNNHVFHVGKALVLNAALVIVFAISIGVLVNLLHVFFVAARSALCAVQCFPPYDAGSHLRNFNHLIDASAGREAGPQDAAVQQESFSVTVHRKAPAQIGAPAQIS